MIKLVNTVGFIAVNKENKILLFKQPKRDQNQKKSSEAPGFLSVTKEISLTSTEEWLIPVFSTEENDDLRVVIKKEMNSLLGCNLDSCEYFNVYFVDISDNFIKKITYFYGEITGEIKLKDKSIDFEWMDLNEDKLMELTLSMEQRKMLLDFLDFIKNKFLRNNK